MDFDLEALLKGAHAKNVDQRMLDLARHAERQAGEAALRVAELADGPHETMTVITWAGLALLLHSLRVASPGMEDKAAEGLTKLCEVAFKATAAMTKAKNAIKAQEQ